MRWSGRHGSGPVTIAKENKKIGMHYQAWTRCDAVRGTAGGGTATSTPQISLTDFLAVWWWWVFFLLGSDVVANDTETIIVGFAKVILMRPWRAGEIVTAMVQLVTTIKVVFREFA